MAEHYRSQIVDDLKTALEQRDGELRVGYDALLDALDENASALVAALAEARERAERRNGIADAARAGLDALDEAIEGGGAARARIEELEDELDAASRALEEAMERIQGLKQGLESQTQATTAAEELARELDRTLEEEKGRHAAVQERLDGAERVLEERAAALREAERQIAELQEAAAAAGERDQLEQALAESRDQVDSVSQRAAELEQTLADKTAALEAERDRAAELEQARESLVGQMTNLQERHAEALVEAQTAQAAEVENLRKEAESLREAAEAQTQVDELRQLLDAERERADIIEQRLREEHARGTKAALAKQLAEALQDREEAYEELVNLRAQLEHAVSRTSAVAAPAEAEREEAASSDSTPVKDAPVGDGEKPKREGNSRKRPLGRLMVEAGSISEAQLQKALQEQQTWPQMRLGDILVEKGYASDVQVAEALAGQCNSKFVRVEDAKVDPQAVRLVSRRLATHHQCVPLRVQGDSLILAMANPLDLIAIEDIELATNHRVKAVVATRRSIAKALKKAYSG